MTADFSIHAQRIKLTAMTLGASLDDRDTWKPSFSPRHFKAAAALAEAVLCQHQADGTLQPPPAGTAERVAQELEKWAGSASATTAFGVRALLMLMEALPIVYIGKASRMSALSLHDRVTFLDALEHAKIGLLVTGVVGMKVPITMLAYELGDDLRSTGFDRPTQSSQRPETLQQVRARLPLAELPPSGQSDRAHVARQVQL